MRPRHIFHRRGDMLLCRPAGSPWTIALCHNPEHPKPWRVYFGGLAQLRGNMISYHFTRREAGAEFKRAVARLACA